MTPFVMTPFVMTPFVRSQFFGETFFDLVEDPPADRQCSEGIDREQTEVV